MRPTAPFVFVLLEKQGTLCLFILIALLASVSFSEWAPDMQILEISTTPDNRTENIRLVNKPKNSEILLGEDVSPYSRLLIKCNATYPVQIIYIGAGRPEFSTFTNVKWREGPEKSMTFEAEASLGLLGFQGALRVEDTGNYTCRSIQNSSVHSYYYIYVPGPALFTPPDGYNSELYYSPQDKHIWIPCAAAHPRAIVSLHKTANGKLQCPSFGQGLAPYDPRKGFHLNLKDKALKNPEGVYVCIASQHNSFRMMEYKLINTNASSSSGGSEGGNNSGPKGPCNPSPCGNQAECSVVDGTAVCYCLRNLGGNPYSECSAANAERCHTNQECPQGQFCVQSKCTRDPCDPSPCGRGSTCQSNGGKARCSCKSGYDGKPPYCLKKCKYNGDCPEQETCVRNYCENPCQGRCGQNALCEVVVTGYNRTITCSCPFGFTGDAYTKCLKNGDDSQSTPCPPGYVGPGPPNCRKVECSSDLDCPSFKTCIDHKCTDIINTCKNACGINSECQPSNGKPKCFCPPGTTGDANVRCFNETIENNPNPCQSNNPCPPNAICETRFRGEIDCVCPPGSTGLPPNCYPINPIIGPQRQCFEDHECPEGQECIGRICVNVNCAVPCGLNAKCVHSACECLDNYVGDPYSVCTSSRSLCNPSPCAPFAECREINGQAECRCILGYEGEPFSQCYPSPGTNPAGPERRPFDSGYQPPSDSGYRPSRPSDRPGSGYQPPKPSGSGYQPPRPSASNSGYQPPSSGYPASASRPFSPGYVDEDIYRPSYSRTISSTIEPPSYRANSNQNLNKKINQRIWGNSGRLSGRDSVTPIPTQPIAIDECEVNVVNSRRFGNFRRSESCPSGYECRRDFNGNARCMCASSSCLPQVNLLPCRRKEDCRFPEVCLNSTCVNPCDAEHSPCTNVAYSECRVIEGNAICSCKRGFVGNPASGLDCRKEQEGESPDEPSEIPDTSSPGSECDAKRRTGCDSTGECKSGKCVCTFGYVGDYPNCRLRCRSNRDCFNAHECRESQCVNPCEQSNMCGRNAFCTVIDHKMKCECEPGFDGGNPWIGCVQTAQIINPNGLYIHRDNNKNKNNPNTKCDGSRCTFF